MLYTVLWIITLHVRLGQFSEHIVNQIATIVFWKYQIAVFPANKSGKQSSVAGKHLAHSLVLALPGGSCTSDDLRGFMTRMLGNCWGDVVTTQIIDGKILWNWPLEKHDLENKFPFQVARASCQLHGVQITWIFWVAILLISEVEVSTSQIRGSICCPKFLLDMISKRRAGLEEQESSALLSKLVHFWRSGYLSIIQFARATEWWKDWVLVQRWGIIPYLKTNCQPQTHHSSQKGHSELAGFVGMMVHTPIADQCLGTEGWFSEK